MNIEIVELPEFFQAADKILTDSELSNLKSELLTNPEKGDLIKKLGGARKIRVGSKGKGKRGGSRVIYYYIVGHYIMLIYIYEKSNKIDLNKFDKKQIRKSINEVERWIKKNPI